MAVIGIDRVYLGVFGDDGNVLTDSNGLGTTGAIEVTSEGMWGTQAVNFQVTKNGEEVDGNNKQVGYIKGMPTAQMDVQFNNLSEDVKNKLMGRVKSGAGYIDSQANTYVGIIARTPTMDQKGFVYYALAKAVPSEKGKNMQTNTSKKVNRIIDEISFEGLSSDKIGGMPYITACSKDDGFKEKDLFDQIFPNQTLIAEPLAASTLSSSKK